MRHRDTYRHGFGFLDAIIALVMCTVLSITIITTQRKALMWCAVSVQEQLVWMALRNCLVELEQNTDDVPASLESNLPLPRWCPEGSIVISRKRPTKDSPLMKYPGIVIDTVRANWSSYGGTRTIELVRYLYVRDTSEDKKKDGNKGGVRE